jgi:steroid delta-isomerase-like uncharacterized protein
MDALTVAQKYFAAWNTRDAGAIVAMFTDGGTYSDPVSGEVSGQAIGDYAAGLFAGFPDLSFEVTSHGLVDDRTLAAQWIMRGTNTGSFMGMPPTGKPISVPGADFIVVEGDRIRSVRGYFDSRVVPDQLGLQVIVQPRSIGPVAFGTSTVMHIGKPRMPGAFSITSLQVKSDQEGAEVTSYGRQMLREVAKMEGFVGSLTGNAGHHYCTVTAWENPEQPKQIYQSTSHNEIMGRFYNSDFTLGGAFGVWVPVHQHYLVRCTQCKRMCDFERSAGKCSCGEALPDPPPYW